MTMGLKIRVAVTGMGTFCCDELVSAMAAEGWDVTEAAGLKELESLATSGAYHLAVVACQDPQKLPRDPVRSLMSLQTDMAVVFLLPGGCELAKCPALTLGASDQVLRLERPVAELLERFKSELESVLADQPEYTVICVDDDEEFLASLKAFLPVRLRGVLPRFALNFEFFAHPAEALAEAEQIAENHLAVVISDQVMPEMEGIELLKRIKDYCPDTHCVLLTGHAALESAVTAINDKVLDKYFFKPIEEPADFASNIRHLLREYYLQLRSGAQQERLQAQFEFIRTMSATDDTEEALVATVDFLQEQFCQGSMTMAIAKNGKLIVSADDPLPQELSPGQPFPEGGTIEWSLRHRRPLVLAKNQNLPPGVTLEPFLSTPLMALPLAWSNVSLGAIVISGRRDSRPFARADRMLASFAADVVAVTISAFEDRRALEGYYVGTMATLMETIEAKDSYTRGHTERVTELAVGLAERIGLSGDDLEHIRRAASLHDIGKIAVPDEIILKPGRLRPEEFAKIKEHPLKADRILQHLRFLDTARLIVRAHHERYDGKGYPDGLSGEEVPIGARILAVADSFDAMTSARPYRKAMTPDDALARMAAEAGRQFDPAIVAAFTQMVRKKTPQQSTSQLARVT